MKCSKCNDTKYYTPKNQRGTVKTLICDKCCTHSDGFWLLKEHYGEHNGMLCCITGCGYLKENDGCYHADN